LLRKVHSTILDRRSPPAADWKKIKAPVLIAYGAEDKLYPPAVSQEVYDLVSEARRREIHCVPNGAHLFTWHQASTINPILVEFLEKP
ncbi:5122_t:CDS:2, partial [Acaulospora colombiana]